MFYRLLLVASLTSAVSCATVAQTATPQSDSPSAVKEELDAASRLAIGRESGEALSYVVRAREHYITYLQSAENNIRELVRTIGCIAQAYITMQLPATDKLKQLMAQYGAKTLCE